MASKVTMYSKNPCPYCVAAKNFLEDRGIAFETIDLTGNMDEMMKIKQQTGWSTFPIILINGKLIGGYTDLRQLDEDGKLESMLA
ncbi:MAG: glutaredoxin [Bdellovibrionaceae bacterium]|nr:glutaredoxin [Pseudobdellovibrionaceae bacterium]